MAYNPLTFSLSEAIQLENQAYYFYSHVSVVLSIKSYPRISKWFKKEALEEIEHATKVEEFIKMIHHTHSTNFHTEEPNDIVDLFYLKVECPNVTLEDFDLESIFQMALDFETKVGVFYNNLATMAAEMHLPEVEDFATEFVKFQVEEVKRFGDLLEQVKRCKGNATALMMFEDRFN